MYGAAGPHARTHCAHGGDGDRGLQAVMDTFRRAAFAQPDEDLRPIELACFGDGRRRVIIDTDPGIDDTLALFLALKSPEIEVVGITTIFGNVTTPRASVNARLLTEMCGHHHVPVVEGALCALLVRVRGREDGSLPLETAARLTDAGGECQSRCRFCARQRWSG